MNLCKLPQDVTDDQAILLSDIFATAYFGAELADIKPGHSVVVFGCGPVGIFAIISAKMMDAGRIFAVDDQPDRLEAAREQGAEAINFSEEDPVDKVRELTGGIGADCAIDAVGVDAECPHGQSGADFKNERDQVAPVKNLDGDLWQPGQAPSQSLRWATEALAKAGTFSIIGVYPPTDTTFPIGLAMNRNLTVRMGNCNHRKYIPRLIEFVKSSTVDITRVLKQDEPMNSVVDAYGEFDTRQPGWLKVAITPRDAMFAKDVRL